MVALAKDIIFVNERISEIDNWIKSLHVVIYKDKYWIILTWSSPLVASKYPVLFQYEVALINNNSQVVTY